MQWLLELETENDPISTCRLMNIFRRKGVSILRLELESGPASYAMMALVETRESDVAHVFHFLRRTEGVREVTCYRRQEPAESPSSPTDDSGTAKGPAGAPTGRLLAAGKPAGIIYTSRSIQGEHGDPGARSNAPVETPAVT